MKNESVPSFNEHINEEMFSPTQAGSQPINKKVADEIFAKYPVVKDIMESVVYDYGIRYAIHDISYNKLSKGTRFTFFFYQSGLLRITKKNAKMYEKHDVSMQSISGEKYNFNVSCTV